MADKTPADHVSSHFGGVESTPSPAGGAEARRQGCVCSTLANAAFRVGAATEPLVDPQCPIHSG